MPNLSVTSHDGALHLLRGGNFMQTDSTSEHWIGLAVKQGNCVRSENNPIHKNALNLYNGREMLWLV